MEINIKKVSLPVITIGAYKKKTLQYTKTYYYTYMLIVIVDLLYWLISQAKNIG